MSRVLGQTPLGKCFIIFLLQCCTCICWFVEATHHCDSEVTKNILLRLSGLTPHRNSPIGSHRTHQSLTMRGRRLRNDARPAPLVIFAGALLSKGPRAGVSNSPGERAQRRSFDGGASLPRGRSRGFQTMCKVKPPQEKGQKDTKSFECWRNAAPPGSPKTVCIMCCVCVRVVCVLCVVCCECVSYTVFHQ